MGDMVLASLFIGRSKEFTNEMFIWYPKEKIPSWCSLMIIGSYTITVPYQQTHKMIDINLSVNFATASVGGTFGKDPQARFVDFDDNWEHYRSFTYRVESFPKDFPVKASVDFKYQNKSSGRIYSGYHETSLGKYKSLIESGIFHGLQIKDDRIL